jgi:co-chaperonin GroES (HSP10)
MQAINHFIVIEKIKEAPKNIGGLEITQSQNNDIRYLRGKVISVGNKIDFLNEGDVVMYDKHAGHGINWKEEHYFVITINDVVIVE